MTDEEREKILVKEIENFKKQLSQLARDVIGNLYSDVLPFILKDTEYNAKRKAEWALQAYVCGYSNMMEGVNFEAPWDRDLVALRLYEANKEQIENAIINAQAKEIERLKTELKYAYERQIYS